MRVHRDQGILFPSPSWLLLAERDQERHTLAKVAIVQNKTSFGKGNWANGFYTIHRPLLSEGDMICAVCERASLILTSIPHVNTPASTKDRKRFIPLGKMVRTRRFIFFGGPIQ